MRSGDYHSWRKVKSTLASALALTAAVLVIAPLGLVFFHLLKSGASSINLAFFTHLPAPVGEPGGGLRLPGKSLADVSLESQLGREDLDGPPPFQPLIPGAVKAFADKLAGRVAEAGASPSDERIHLAGGELDVTSTTAPENAGTRVSFWLPIDGKSPKQS